MGRRVQGMSLEQEMAKQVAWVRFGKSKGKECWGLDCREAAELGGSQVTGPLAEPMLVVRGLLVVKVVVVVGAFARER